MVSRIYRAVDHNWTAIPNNQHDQTEIYCIQNTAPYELMTSFPDLRHMYRSPETVARLRRDDAKFQDCADYDSTSLHGYTSYRGDKIYLCMNHPMSKRSTFNEAGEAQKKGAPPKTIGGLINLSYMFLYLVSSVQLEYRFS